MEKVIAEVFERYPQMGLPIMKGARDTEAFRNAVFRGMPIAEPAENFIGDGRDSFTTVTTPAGEAEILFLYGRADFENAVRCLSAYCEPIDVAASMGAQTIGGLINWKKINDHRRDYLANGGFLWAEEMKRFTSVRENYRDYLIILSSGPYSAVSEDRAGQTLGASLTAERWRSLSVRIRKYHELTHFIACRMYPDHKEAIRDEIVADAIGLVAAFGRYEADLARVFLGLEGEEYREGGRLQNYYDGEDPSEAQKRARRIIDEMARFLNGSYAAEPDEIFNLVRLIEENRVGMFP